MTCNVADDYGFRRRRKICYANKRGDFNFDYSSVLKKLKAAHCFTTAIATAKAQNYASLFLKIGLNFNVSLLKVFTVESVVRNETARLFYGILPLFKCFVAAVIPVILVSLIFMYKWFKCTHKGNSFIKKFLCGKILQLEKIAYKDQPTEEDCLTLQI